jgi:predicted aconitase with swiveling domain
VLDEPLSFWGGMDPSTGRLIDAHHPQAGAVLTGRVLMMPSGRGSSSSTSVYAEALRAGTAPAAILLRRADEVIVLGALVARELYRIDHPVVRLDDSSYGAIATGEVVEVTCAGDVATVHVAAAR